MPPKTGSAPSPRAPPRRRPPPPPAPQRPPVLAALSAAAALPLAAACSADSADSSVAVAVAAAAAIAVGGGRAEPGDEAAERQLQVHAVPLRAGAGAGARACGPARSRSRAQRAARHTGEWRAMMRRAAMCVPCVIAHTDTAPPTSAQARPRPPPLQGTAAAKRSSVKTAPRTRTKTIKTTRRVPLQIGGFPLLVVLGVHLPQHSAALPRGEAKAGRDVAKFTLLLRCTAHG